MVNAFSGGSEEERNVDEDKENDGALSANDYDKAILLSASGNTDDEEQVEGTQLVPPPI